MLYSCSIGKWDQNLGNSIEAPLATPCGLWKAQPLRFRHGLEGLHPLSSSRPLSWEILEKICVLFCGPYMRDPVFSSPYEVLLSVDKLLYGSFQEVQGQKKPGIVGILLKGHRGHEVWPPSTDLGMAFHSFLQPYLDSTQYPRTGDGDRTTKPK